MEVAQLMSGKSHSFAASPMHPSSQELAGGHEPAAMQAWVILPEQSHAMLQIFLNAAVASVLYTRQLLKHDCPVFSSRCVADLMAVSGPVSYHDFLKLDTQAGDVKSQGFKILLKGRSRRADKVLRLLEGGVFDALQSGYLEAIQVSLCTDSDRPSEVIECYTFDFASDSSLEPSSRSASRSIVSPGSSAHVIAGDVQRSFNAAIKGLLKTIHHLPQLPRRRNLGLNLFYTPGCPASYEPRGFTKCSNDEFYFPGGQGLARKSTKTCYFSTGAHRLGVVVSHVDSAKDAQQLRVVPENIDYAIKRSRRNEYRASTKEGMVSNSNPSARPLSTVSQQLPGTNITATSETLSTQTRADIRTKQALQQMQRSSSRPPDLAPTQCIVNTGISDGTDGTDSSLPRQSFMNTDPELCGVGREVDRKHMVVPEKMAELLVHVKSVQNRCAVNEQIFDEGDLDLHRIKRIRPGEKVRCECKNDTMRGRMLLCEICGAWQHQACYGWDAAFKKTRPDDHVCYSCLLLPTERILNDWMPTLVRCRNALKYLYSHGFPVDGDYRALAEVIYFDGDSEMVVKSDVMEVLIQQQLIEQTGHGWRLIEANRNEGMLKFTDPLASISHLYQTEHKQANSSAMRETAVISLKLKYTGHPLDAICTRDSFGDSVIRFGYYSRRAVTRSAKRPASAAMDSPGARPGIDDTSQNQRPVVRKMSRSDMVCFNETSSEAQTETALESDDEDLYS